MKKTSAAGSNGTSSASLIQTFRYGECQKNHAADIGGYAVDGCREFMATGEEATDVLLLSVLVLPETDGDSCVGLAAGIGITIGVVGAIAGPGAIVTCKFLCCPAGIMNATSAAASVSASCLYSRARKEKPGCPK
ncbi:ZF-HD homeobox protein, Cys/His-rich dimerization domain-containing protein [Cynara cardunculus var. scolymus]|uniref:ZF-HD homeobox protein, Cys/His-rich dimerization domain-containing protein n=1 Tax=Cynara cardunculus var. scolymus TaxID=59895 RepID=A0A124SE33_CYNCS|nr:ZF-HD homeobox protein, Cys/His-rich dimerization domain-containing protein [Cynara cardunculus var. scolymus]